METERRKYEIAKIREVASRDGRTEDTVRKQDRADRRDAVRVEQ